jgi:CelD/BcsL family acetyltransferase involved in cellulose biosynthesis
MPAPALGTSTVTVSTSAGGLAAIRDEWRGLAEAEGNPYLTPEWLDACLSRGESPVVISVRSHDGALGGLLPLVRRGSGPLRDLHFPGDDLGDTYTMLVAPAADPDHVAGLAGRALRASGVRWDTITLAYVDLEAPWLRSFTAGLGAVTTLVRSSVVRPYIDLTVGSWEGFLAALKRTDRKETRRRERRAIEAGATYRLVEAPEDVDAGMRELFRLHDLRWSGDEASSVASAPIRRFLVEFALAAARRGWLRLWLIEIEGRPRAAELAWCIGARQLHYQGGFDPENAALGLGLVGFSHALEVAIGAGVTEADLGMGESDYKRRFARHQRIASRVVVVRRRHPMRPVLAAGFWARRRLKSALSERRMAQLRRLRRS